MLKQKPAALLFDLDGTLVDTAPDLIGAINTLRAERGQNPMPVPALRPEASNGARGLLRAAFGVKPGDPDYDACRARFLELYSQRLSDESTLFDGVEDLLAALDQRGITWGIVTNKPIALARPLVKALGLKPAVLLGGDSASAPKPAPDALYLASSHLRQPASRCWYVGDAPRDIAAGRAAGMATLAAAWGYLRDPLEADEWAADAVLPDPRQLATLLDTHATIRIQ